MPKTIQNRYIREWLSLEMTSEYPLIPPPSPKQDQLQSSLETFLVRNCITTPAPGTGEGLEVNTPLYPMGCTGLPPPLQRARLPGGCSVREAP